MHDGIKLECINAINKEQLLANPIFSWVDEVDQETGYIRWTKGRYHNLKIHVSNRSIEIKGSLHKLYNSITSGIAFNYNDYTFSQLVDTVEHIEKVFGMDTTKAIVSNLETSLNAITSNSPKDIIENGLILWDRKSQCDCEDFGTKGVCKKFRQGDRVSKYYDKGLKEGLEQNLFRYEMCQRKNREVAKVIEIDRMAFLSDLIKEENAKTYFNHTIECFEKSLIVDKADDSFKLGNLKLADKSKELEVFQKGINPIHWNKLKGKPKQRFKEKFSRLIRTHGLDSDFKEILSKLRGKVDVLFCNLENEKCHKITTFENPHNSPDDGMMSQNHSNVYGVDKTSSKPDYKYCQITGIEITHQKQHEFVSEHTLREIKKNRPDEFEKLLSQYPIKDAHKKTDMGLCYDLAHKFRNIVYNPIHNAKRRIDKAVIKYENSLFPFINPKNKTA